MLSVLYVCGHLQRLATHTLALELEVGGEKERTHELVLVSQDFPFGRGRGQIERESLVTVARIQWTR